MSEEGDSCGLRGKICQGEGHRDYARLQNRSSSWLAARKYSGEEEGGRGNKGLAKILKKLDSRGEKKKDG